MAQTAWNKLVVAYASGSKPQIHKLKTTLHILLTTLQHLFTNDDLFEFVLARLGPTYHAFTRSLESCQKDIWFDALYRLFLNEERSLKR
ncbi:hypothetical protein H5410_050715 [Solanum commersonii]|uniref:Uncharacterized protein n=1 Tax=Solanum commersonii TaxID=4109 RepID=A0A9J5WYS1_SOLCO|nr:hypothetical protein H5410_050715 [Solanum commersonii]